MKRALGTVVLALLLASAAAAQDVQETGKHWTASDIATLTRWVDAAPLDALPRPSSAELERAVAGGDPREIDGAANALALRLARMHLLGASTVGERKGWNIADSDAALVLEPMLARAVADDTLDTFFAMLRPSHPDYSALRAAYASHTDPRRRETIARNMERWRWMPRSLGPDYVLVNAARFEATLWRKGEQAGTWRVIVGKPSTPTPVFHTDIEGVILNPWWEIPASIVRESVGALIRRSPALARQRGYVWGGGTYRQRPGPNNALGQMKLVMPNPYSVFMHDTPNKQLFNEEVRAFSHGCIRTGDAIGYAATLLEGVRSREEIDRILASRETTTVPLAQPIPLYVTYFTAFGDGRGGIALAPDIYKRDGLIRTVVAAAPPVSVDSPDNEPLSAASMLCTSPVAQDGVAGPAGTG